MLRACRIASFHIQVFKMSLYCSQHDGAACCVYFVLSVCSNKFLFSVQIKYFNFPPRRVDGKFGGCQRPLRATDLPRRSRSVIRIH